MGKKEIYVVTVEWNNDGEINFQVKQKSFTNIAKANECAQEIFRKIREEYPYKRYADEDLHIVKSDLFCKIPDDDYYFHINVETTTLEE